MNLTAVTLLPSMAAPVLLAVLLIWVARRGRAIIPFAMIFLVGGFASFVLALGTSRILLPLESIIAGAPGSVRASLVSAFLTAAFSEELARIVVSACWIAAMRNLARQNVVVTCGMISLGFAMFENMFYSLTTSAGAAIIVERLVPTVSHAATGIIMGSLLQRAVSPGRPFPFRPFLLALAVPCFLHGLYDFGAFVLEASEFPELPENPTIADLEPLGAILATMLLISAVALVELIWGALAMYRLRMNSESR